MWFYKLFRFFSRNSEIYVLSNFLYSRWKLKFFSFILRKTEPLNIFELGKWKDQICFLGGKKIILVAWCRMDWRKRESRGKLGGCCNIWAKDEQIPNPTWHGDQKIKIYLRCLGFNRISWQIVDVGACMHIHAFKYAGLWCEKERRFKNCAHVSNLDNQEDGGKGVEITWRL